MTPKITISFKDGLADVYAFATLYNYLVENDFPADFYFTSNSDKDRDIFLSLIEKPSCERLLFFPTYDLEHILNTSNIILSAYSDVSSQLGYNNVQIDLSILKNCVKSITEKQRAQLREKYQIPSDKPVLVVGCPSDGRNGNISLEKIVPALHDIASIYLVGSVEQSSLSELVKEKSKIVKSRGVLRDYYSLADITIMHANISDEREQRPLHNFVEATEGGPLFLVKPENTAQYGYKQLVYGAVIQECENTNDLIAKVRKYLENPCKEIIQSQRKNHLDYSRKVYLPDLMNLLKKLLSISNETLHSDLKFTGVSYECFERKFLLSALRVIHPETCWDSLSCTYNNLKWLTRRKIDKRCFRRLEEVK